MRRDGAGGFNLGCGGGRLATFGARNVSLTYDPLGRLWQVSGNSGTKRFLYDGDELVGEYNAAGTLLRRYVHGASVDDPISGTKAPPPRPRRCAACGPTGRAAWWR